MRLFVIATALVVFTACGPAGAQIGEDAVTDTDVTGDADTDADADSDTDADADSDTDADADTDPPGSDFWTGYRDFVFEPMGSWDDGCEERAEESGPEVTLDPEFPEALAACPDCDQIFEIIVDPDRICDGQVPLASPVVRGVDWGEDGDVTLFRIDWNDWQNGGRWEASVLAERVEVGDDGLHYAYSVDDWGMRYDVTGFATIE